MHEVVRVRWLNPGRCWCVTDLESSSDAKDAVIGFLGRETLQGLLNGFRLFGDEIIASFSGVVIFSSVIETVTFEDEDEGIRSRGVISE